LTISGKILPHKHFVILTASIGRVLIWDSV